MLRSPSLGSQAAQTGLSSDVRASSGRHQLTRRRGAAAVELAICLPLLAIIMLGTVETCSMIHFKHNLTLAAYEGTRVAILPTAQSENVEVHVEQILSDRSVAGATVTVTPEDISTAAVGEFITVTVVAPCRDNSPLANWIYENRTVKCEVQMMKEF